VRGIEAEARSDVGIWAEVQVHMGMAKLNPCLTHSGRVASAAKVTKCARKLPDPLSQSLTPIRPV
jgi:hypothetical protein